MNRQRPSAPSEPSARKSDEKVKIFGPSDAERTKILLRGLFPRHRDQALALVRNLNPTTSLAKTALTRHHTLVSANQLSRRRYGLPSPGTCAGLSLFWSGIPAGRAQAR